MTSAFPIYSDSDDEASQELFEEKFARVVSQFIAANPVSPRVKSYISLYSMGGAVAKVEPEESAFWYRHKPFVIQIESWWNYRKSAEGKCREEKKWQQGYIDWVQRFRAILLDAGLVEGAFINFIDKDLDLREYYGGNFERLRKLKSEWDPTGFFGFEMGIPPV